MLRSILIRIPSQSQFCRLFPLIIMLLILPLLFLYDNPAGVETEKRAPRIGKTIAQNPILRCADVIASYTPTSPTVLLPPPSLPPPLLDWDDIHRSAPLLPLGPIQGPSSSPLALTPPTPLHNKDNEDDDD